MNNCERCCFFEFCTERHRTENKDCVYGKKDKDKGEMSPQESEVEK